MFSFRGLSANLTIIFLFAVVLSAQEQTREHKIRELQTLKTKIEQMESQLEEAETRRDEIERDVIAPSENDIAEAKKENASVFRIFPRGLLEDKISVRGGGAYFSFTNESHDYNDTPQIELQGNEFLVGFAGADYGFITDLGGVSLSEINGQTKAVKSLIEYRPPTAEKEARNEYRKANTGFEIEKTKYARQIPAIVGHTYALRAISYDEADVLVVFKVHRSDERDGSLIIFYKIIENFAPPRLQRSNTAVNSSQNSDLAIEIPDLASQSEIQSVLNQSGLINVMVEATDRTITLRGTVPKGKMAEAVQKAQETGKRRVKNELTEQ
jgi:hypothetical protein